MATKMKGFFKGFKHITSIFAVKEHQMEIGHPTDVKHVAHIGWDSSSSNAPSWMREFKTSSDYTSASFSNFGNMESSWISQGILAEPEITQSRSLQSTSFNSVGNKSPNQESKSSKKIKRKKPKDSSSPSSNNNKTNISASKTKSSEFRASCAAAMEEPYLVGHDPKPNQLSVI